ncbi:molybdopterin oxidoreductase family protein [Halopiger xanaduensis]|uniref:Nitrate reductase n=1 Tax=Halopiger xanaduensis (strain DSM 18323 / JCM 14033 / SH-6) TaxID=797210 RepID=F8DB42_HALXS|nr:formate dehydrogenase subunit alpha [Halopiger xanaduensis]AEH38342.1 Nitrate reductase [Halopiger xanaduensis SH-6]
MSTEPVTLDLDRRSFMKASALAGATILGSGATGRVLSDGQSESTGVEDDAETAKVICNYCSVGCGFKAVKEGDSFVGQEPWKENPINNGSLCSKGASILETEHSPTRLKHPLKKENGEWRKITWNEAYDEIAETWQEVTEEYGPDSTMMVGSAHHSNEEAYAFRKLAAFMGTNNVDHQARICHSPTVAGLANTWGFGAMTNTINDYRNFDLNIIIGQNPAEAHPIAMQHILEGQARGGTIVSIDPRYTKTSAHADHYYRMRPGTDVAIMMGLLYYLDEQDELDEEMLSDRVNGWEDAYAELDRYDLETAAEISWLSVEDLEEIGDMIIENKPNVQIEWAMGGTQHNNGTQNIRSYALLSLASGSAARSGGGLQVMRGHANVQGATDLGVDADILPGYYSVSSPGSWAHWTNVWDRSPWTSGSTDFNDMYGRFDMLPEDLMEELGETEETVTTAQVDTEVEDSLGGDEYRPNEVTTRSMMFQSGLTVARWYEAALPQEERLHESNLYQPNPLKMLFLWGHSANSINEMDKMKRAMEALDLLVVVDVFPAVAGTLSDEDNVILLPASSQYEHYRSLTNTHRSVQWSEPAGKPAHNSKPDLQIMQELADRFGFGEHFDWGSGQELHNGKSTYEDALREINLGVRSIGYQQPPEKLQQHREYDYAFNTETLRADSEGLPVSGEYWSLPWPYWGEGHTGTPIIWRDDMDPREGGHDFRANWGTEAPSPEDWEAMGVDREYPLQETYDEHGEEGLEMLREPYQPDWWDEEIEGVPQYPHYTTTLPEDVTNPSEMSLPVEYALSPDQSPYDAAQALEEEYDHELDMEFWEQYDVEQPDPPTGRGKARAVAWNFLDTVPVHREPIESPYPDLAEEWPANGHQQNVYRLDQNNGQTQQQATEAVHEKGFEVILTSGRQVEHQGGGSETRNNEMTADRQPHMYAEIHPDRAEEMGISGGDEVIVHSAHDAKSAILVKAKVDYRPHPDEVFLPYHWGGVFGGKDKSDDWPEGTKPLAIGDSVNIVTAHGFDAETQMQETKVGMVRVEKATPERIEELDMEFIDFPQDEAGLGLQKQYDVREHDMLADD